VTRVFKVKDWHSVTRYLLLLRPVSAVASAQIATIL